MNCASVITLAVISCWLLAMAGCSREKPDKTSPELFMRGKELFSHYCAGCHPDGENRIYPQKTLHRMDLKANGITTPADIVGIMRNPRQGMKQFDRQTIPDHDAFAVAQYILVTF
jgi:mono/diheme cytochrome c family protein